MKKAKWIAALCLVLSVLTVGTTFARYATTLSDSFLLSIVAQVYNLTLDANGGTFDDGKTTMSLNQTGNKDFGQHSNPSQNSHTFLGWSTEKNSIICDFEKDENIVVSQHNTTLYAVWGLDVSFETNEKGTGEDSPVHVFQEKDGDTICIDLNLATANYERLSIPLTDLDPDAVYKVSFTYEGSGTYHNYPAGFFGWKVIDSETEKKYLASIKNLQEILGDNEFNKAMASINHLVAKNDQSNGAFKLDDYHEDYFVSTGSTMYLFFEYSNVQDGTNSYQYLKNLKIEKITNASSVKFNSSDALVSSSDYFDGDAGSYNFTMKSLNGTYERLGFKIPQTFDTNKKYKVSFTFKNTATTKTYGSSSYFGFIADSILRKKCFPICLHLWI